MYCSLIAHLDRWYRYQETSSGMIHMALDDKLVGYKICNYHLLAQVGYSPFFRGYCTIFSKLGSTPNLLICLLSSAGNLHFSTTPLMHLPTASLMHSSLFHRCVAQLLHRYVLRTPHRYHRSVQRLPNISRNGGGGGGGLPPGWYGG